MSECESERECVTEKEYGVEVVCREQECFAKHDVKRVLDASCGTGMSSQPYSLIYIQAVVIFLRFER